MESISRCYLKGEAVLVRKICEKNGGFCSPRKEESGVLGGPRKEGVSPALMVGAVQFSVLQTCLCS